MEKDKQENFERAFSTHGAGCRRECNCGQEFYNPNGGWDWEDGELEKLEKSNAVPVEWSVGTIMFEGKEYVADCGCWHERAERIMGFIDGHAEEIAQYLTLEKKRKQTIADQSPVVSWHTMTDSIEPLLALCPFCGSEAKPFQETPSAYWRVACNYWHCGAVGPDRKYKEDAIEAWNTRHRHSVTV